MLSGIFAKSTNGVDTNINQFESKLLTKSDNTQSLSFFFFFNKNFFKSIKKMPNFFYNFVARQKLFK